MSKSERFTGNRIPENVQNRFTEGTPDITGMSGFRREGTPTSIVFENRTDSVTAHVQRVGEPVGTIGATAATAREALSLVRRQWGLQEIVDHVGILEKSKSGQEKTMKPGAEYSPVETVD